MEGWDIKKGYKLCTFSYFTKGGKNATVWIRLGNPFGLTIRG